MQFYCKIIYDAFLIGHNAAYFFTPDPRNLLFLCFLNVSYLLKNVYRIRIPENEWL